MRHNLLKGQWNLLGEVKSDKPNEIEALAYVPTDSPWFVGHFPGEPILPGIALIHMAEQAIIRHTEKRSEQVKLSALRRVRFTQPVKPGENLSLNISGEELGNETLFSFKVANSENIVCSGLIIAQKIKKDKKV
jgi:3-hydroxymyristoyl/3-hydroxydecanoyl-(acyl carrier protein) dehydratase